MLRLIRDAATALEVALTTATVMAAVTVMAATVTAIVVTVVTVATAKIVLYSEHLITF